MEKQVPTKKFSIVGSDRGRHACGHRVLEHGDQIRCTAVNEPVKPREKSLQENAAFQQAFQKRF